MYHGTEIKPVGKYFLKVTNPPKNKKEYIISFMVVNRDVNLILGSETIQKK